MGVAPRAPGGKRVKIYRFRETNFNSSTSKDVEISVTSVPNYKKLTVDNFYIVEVGVNPRSTEKAAIVTRRYNPDRGIVTVGLNVPTTNVSLYNAVEIVCVTTE